MGGTGVVQILTPPLNGWQLSGPVPSENRARHLQPKGSSLPEHSRHPWEWRLRRVPNTAGRALTRGRAQGPEQPHMPLSQDRPSRAHSSQPWSPARGSPHLPGHTCSCALNPPRRPCHLLKQHLGLMLVHSKNSLGDRAPWKRGGSQQGPQRQALQCPPLTSVAQAPKEKREAAPFLEQQVK